MLDLQASVLAAVVLLSLLSLLVLAANAWLEGSRVLGSKAGGKLSLQLQIGCWPSSTRCDCRSVTM
jgi:hypothetical protein